MHRLTRKAAAVLCLILLIVACSTALSADAAPKAAPPPAQQPGFWSKLLNSTFGLVLLFIFLPVLITTFIAARQRDRCLKTFHRFHATVYTKAARPIWGILHVFSKGLVIRYRQPVDTQARPAQSSYMMYEPDMENVHAIFRFHDQIDERNKERRDRQIRSLAYPSFTRRTWRRIRNLVNTLRDAFSKAIGALMGQVQRAKPGSKALKTGGKEMTGIGTTLLGQVANAYEPILEKHIGTPVVLEITGPAEGQKKEYPGQLGEYSAGYLMVLDIEAEIEDAATVGGPGAFDDQVRATRTNDQIEVCNGLSVGLRVISVEVGGRAVSPDAEVEAGATATLPLSLSEITPTAPAEAASGEEAPPPPPPSDVVVRLAARRRTDIMAPRGHAIIRHGGVRKDAQAAYPAGAMKSFRLFSPDRTEE